MQKNQGKNLEKIITLPSHYQTLAKCYKLLSKSLENITKPRKKSLHHLATYQSPTPYKKSFTIPS